MKEYRLILGAIASVVAGLLFWWFAPGQENFKIFALIGFVLMMCAIGLLLQHAGKLEKTMKGWAKDGLPGTGFVISLMTAAWLAHDAYLDGHTGWDQPSHVWVAVGVAFLFGLATVGLLEGFLELCGNGIALFFGIIGSILSGKHSLGLAMIMWGLILAGGGVALFSGSKLELFEDVYGLPQAVFDTVKFVIAIGFFLIVFSVLAFMVKGKK